MKPFLTRRRRDEYDRGNGQAGLIAPTSRAALPATSALSAPRLYLQRFVPSHDMRVTALGFAVTSAANNDDACAVGIYDSDAATLLASSASTTGKLNSTGSKSITLTASVTLTAGRVYYAAFAIQTVAGTGATLVFASWQNAAVATLFGSAAPNAETFFANSGTVVPIPTGSVPGGGVGATAPMLAVLEG